MRLARGHDMLDVGRSSRCEAGGRVRAVHRAELADDVAFDRLGIRVALLVVRRAAMLGRDGQAPPRLGRSAGDESEGDHGDEAAECEARPGAARSYATALRRGRFSVQHCPGVVVRPGMVRVGVLGEDKQLARIVGPIAQGMEVERAPKRCGCRRSFDASQRIAIPHAPPTFHFTSPSAVPGPRARTVHGVTRAVELHLKLTQVLHLKVTHLEEPEYGSSVLGFSSFCLLSFLRRAVFEAVAIVAGFNDVAVMSQPVE